MDAVDAGAAQPEEFDRRSRNLSLVRSGRMDNLLKAHTWRTDYLLAGETVMHHGGGAPLP